MQTKTRASAVKIYLFFLFISLFAVSGCGLDIDFGSGDDNNINVKTNETIIGIIENIPSTYDGSSFVVKASTIRGENKEKCCEAAGVSEDEEFSIEGDLDPEVELEIFESGDENSPIGKAIGKGRIEIFPGATIKIEDITIEVDRDIDYDREKIDITFNGEVSNNEDCSDGNGEINGQIEVTISSEGSEPELITVKLNGTEIWRENDPMCHQISPGREVEIDGKLTNDSKTVEATIIEIE